MDAEHLFRFRSQSCVSNLSGIVWTKPKDNIVMKVKVKVKVNAHTLEWDKSD